MIRALYTAASGMNAQQANIDNVAHNLANVNTVGFKKSRVEFEDLVYQQTKAPGAPTSATGEAPVGLEMGLGTRAVATSRDFGRGNLRSTSGPLDMAIEGDGFFQVTLPTARPATRAPARSISTRQGAIVTADGYPIEPQITIPANATSITHLEGRHRLGDRSPARRAPQQLGTHRAGARSRTRPGSTPLGGNLFAATTASGEPTTGVAGHRRRAARSRRASSRTPTSASSRRWST